MPKKQWLYLGIGTEVFHIGFIIAILVMGRMWLPEYVVDLAITLTVMGQIIFFWCPLSVFSNYCFRKHDPDMKFIPSISLFLYSRYGRLVGIPIFIALVLISTVFGIGKFW